MTATVHLPDPRTDEALGSIPPTVLAAEQHVLGSAILTGGVCIDECELHPDDFADPVHAALWGLLTSMWADRAAIDPMTVRARVDEATDPPLANADWALMHRLIAGVPTPASAGWYARIVRDAADVRLVQKAGTRMVQASTAMAAEDAKAWARKILDGLDVRDAGGDARDASDLLFDLTEELEKGVEPALGTPWADLDRLIVGLRPGALYVIGARPGIGKSVIGLNLAWHVAHKHGRPALLHSLEMPCGELMGRLMSAVASVDYAAFARRQLTEEAWDRLGEVSGKVAAAPLLIDDRAGVRVADIRAQVRLLSRRTPLGVVVVDYLQLLTPTDLRVSREQQVAECSRHLKLLAKDAGVPVVLLAQLNRQVEARADKHPHLSDLRESGALEQDADVVLLLFRDLDGEEEADVLEIGVAKNRQGATGAVSLAWQGRFMRAVSLSRLRAVAS